jgi:phage terminase small subunit
MFQMGRPRKAPDERRIEGNRSRRSIPVDVFVPEGTPFVPEHLNDDAQACIEHIMRCFPAKRLTAADTYALTAFASAWAWHKAAVHAMNAPDFEPIITNVNGNLVPNPWFGILNNQAKVMLAYATKLYLAPADRASLHSVGQEPPKTKFDGLFGTEKGPTGLSGSLNA